MSLPLDYIGKFVIVLVAVAVGVGIIMSTQGNVEDVIPDLGENDGPESEIVDIGGSSAQKAQKVAAQVDICYEESQQRRHESFTCFIARSDTGTFSLSPGDIESQLSVDASNVNFDPEGGSYDRQTIIIRYSVAGQEVVVTE